MPTASVRKAMNIHSFDYTAIPHLDRTALPSEPAALQHPAIMPSCGVAYRHDVTRCPKTRQVCWFASGRSRSGVSGRILIRFTAMQPIHEIGSEGLPWQLKTTLYWSTTRVIR